MHICNSLTDHLGHDRIIGLSVVNMHFRLQFFLIFFEKIQCKPKFPFVPDSALTMPMALPLFQALARHILNFELKVSYYKKLSYRREIARQLRMSI